jgi:hypothetical protein
VCEQARTAIHVAVDGREPQRSHPVKQAFAQLQLVRRSLTLTPSPFVNSFFARPRRSTAMAVAAG